MPRRLVTLLVAASFAATATSTAMPALAMDLAEGLAACQTVAEAPARLACYDRLARPDALARFSGKGSAITPDFQVTTPARLNFTSKDVIMVLYLLDETGAVVQNLHRAGAGEGTFLIQQPGSYSVQVNATGDWQIEVVPETAAGTNG